MEHGPVTMQSLADMSRAADLWGMTSLVRAAAIDHRLISLTLSNGVDRVIVPRVNTRKEAELIVDAAKYEPLGHRAVGNDRHRYGMSVDEYRKKANKDTFVAIMIEDIVGAENLPEILKVPNIDMIYVSHHDFAQSMGLLTDPQDPHENPKAVAAFDKAIKTIVKAGRVAGAAVQESELEKYLTMGVRCINVPAWRTYIQRGAREFVRKVEATAKRLQVISA